MGHIRCRGAGDRLFWFSPGTPQDHIRTHLHGVRQGAGCPGDRLVGGCHGAVCHRHRPVGLHCHGGYSRYRADSRHYDHTVASTDINAATFALLETLPLHQLTIVATIIAAFLFIVSVVSAAFVLAMFTAGGDENPPTRLKVVWGMILGALGLVMIITDSVDAVRAIIALSANPFVFIITLMMVCLFVALKAEKE